MKKGIVISLIAVSLVMVLFAVIIWNSENGSNLYIRNYEKELGIWGDITPKKLIEKYGEPEEISSKVPGNLSKQVTIKIDGNTFVFVGFFPTEEEAVASDPLTISWLAYYILENDHIKLGNKKISVGSSREDVLSAYGSDGFGEIPGTEYLIASGAKGGIFFYYDENDKVNKIEAYPYSIA